MVKVAKDELQLLMIGQFSRFQAGNRYLFVKISGNSIGKLRKLNLYRKTAPFWGITDKLIIDLLIHDFDYVSWLMGQPNSVESHVLHNSKGYISDEVAILKFPSSMAIIEGSNSLPAKYPFSNGYRAIFERGTIEFNWKWVDSGPDYQLLEFNTEDGPVSPIIIDKDPYLKELKYVTSAVSNRLFENNIIAGDQMLNSLKIAIAAQKSAEKKGTPYLMEKMS